MSALNYPNQGIENALLSQTKIFKICWEKNGACHNTFGEFSPKLSIYLHFHIISQHYIEEGGGGEFIENKICWLKYCSQAF